MSNSKIKILLIEDDIEKRLEFKSQLPFYPAYEICGETGSEKEGLLLINNADIVILDLELKEGNGISFAEKMRKLPILQPFVIVTTNICSESIHQYLRNELKIDFIYQKTNIGYSANRIFDIIEKVYKYHQYAKPQKISEKEQIKKLIYLELHNMGFPSNYIGTEYLAYALLYLAEHKGEPLQVTKSLYPTVAQNYNTESVNVEKSIRTVIEKVWSTANLLTLSRYYPFEVKNINGRPSNSEFLTNMATKMFGR